jgi:hypothetical protein
VTALVLVAIWIALLTATAFGPSLGGSPTLGDDLTRFTVRVSLLYYAIAVAGMLARVRCGWVRICWTLAWLAYLVHLAMAFEHYHHWSHAEAMRHTEKRSGYGEGIFASHFFTLLWTADVLSWWIGPAWHEGRPKWIEWALHVYMAFVVFNATVVYETGFIRWAGAAMFVGLLLLAFRVRVTQSVSRRERET